MPKEYPLAVWTRKKWQDERDKADVPKGASSKVSMGEKLDRFRKKFAKWLKQRAEDSEKIKAKVTIYKASVKTRHPKLVKRIEGNLGYNLDAFLKDYELIGGTAKVCNEVLDEIKEIWPGIREALKTWLDEHPEPTEDETFGHGDLKALRKALG